MPGRIVRLIALLVIAAAPRLALAQTKAAPKQNLSTDELPSMTANEREAAFYRIVDVPMPAEGVMEAGSVLALPDGRLVVGTRRGEIYFAQRA